MARLRELELDAMDAVVVLHTMVKLDYCDKELLAKVVDVIECKYFGMELGLPRHDAADLFEHSGSFQSLVNGLPIDHKVKLILRDDFARPAGLLKRRRVDPEPDARQKWKTMDPVEMEMWEREQYEKGRIRVKRMRDVRARETRMQPGNRLRAILGVQLLQMLPTATPRSLAQISQACAFSEGKPRLLHGDLQTDFEEQLARRVAQLDNLEVTPYLLALTSAMRTFAGPESFRAWRRRLLPTTVWVCHPKKALSTSLLAEQELFHPRLRGLEHPRAGAASAAADRAAHLFISVASARQVSLDVELFDLLVGPLRTLARRWLAAGSAQVSEAGAGNGAAEAREPFLPLETLADVCSALESCGVHDDELPRLLADIFIAQYGNDIKGGRFACSSYSILDLCSVSHAASLLGGDVEELLSLIWAAAQPKIGECAPYAVLMLLNALVRGGSEELLTSAPILSAVDELLVQRLDYDSATLGKLGA